MTFICFQNSNVELRLAVRDYVTGGKLYSTQRYGPLIGDWCVEHVTDFSRVFANLPDFDEPLHGWSTTRATNMSFMFAGATSFNQNLEHYNVSNVVDFQSMFAGATSFDQDLHLWATDLHTTSNTVESISDHKLSLPGRVINMESMFEGAVSFRQNLCSWGGHNARLLTKHMFRKARSCPASHREQLYQDQQSFCFPCQSKHRKPGSASEKGVISSTTSSFRRATTEQRRTSGAVSLAGNNGQGPCVKQVGKSCQKGSCCDDLVCIRGICKSRLEKLFRDMSPTKAVEFDDPGSYQSKALAYVEGISTIKMAKLNKVQTQQLFALACIYHATNRMENAYTEQHDVQIQRWLTSDMWLDSDGRYCQWKGIICDGRGRVKELDLSSNWLTGVFPSEVTYLRKSLIALNLHNNMLYNHGDDGNNFFGKLTKLRRLYLSENNFQYLGVPTAFATLRNLEELDLSYNLYFGPLQGKVFRKMKKLQFLGLSGNAYYSPLPLEITRLPKLKYLYVEYADLYGSLADLFRDPTSWPSIVELWMDRNPKLEGQIPTALGNNVATLQSLSITSCGLTGILPKSLGKLTNLTLLYLYNNTLTGPIPAALDKLKKLERLELHGNKLEGNVPQYVCWLRLGRLEHLTVDCDVGCDALRECCTCCGDDCASGRRRLIKSGTAGKENRRRQERRSARMAASRDRPSI